METDYHVDEDLSDDTYRLSPNQPITRQEAAQFLYYFIRNFLNVHYPAIARDETIAPGPVSYTQLKRRKVSRHLGVKEFMR